MISTDPARVDRGAVHAFLSVESYWARGIPLEVVELAIENSMVFGLYAGSRQVGFARVISDLVTFAYLADVYVVAEMRGQGLGKWLVEAILSHPDLQDLRRWTLATLDAHALYSQFGFTPVAKPQHWMERADLDVYLRLKESPSGSAI